MKVSKIAFFNNQEEGFFYHSLIAQTKIPFLKVHASLLHASFTILLQQLELFLLIFFKLFLPLPAQVKFAILTKVSLQKL